MVDPLLPTDETPADSNPQYEKLKELRKRTDLEARKASLLRDTFLGFDGLLHPLKLRYYQVQGLMHLLVMKRFVLGDDTGLGKTIQAIAALCYLWEKSPDLKVIILTPKSAVEQWAGEFAKFTTGVKTFVCRGSPAKRRDIRAVYERTKGPTVLITGYRIAVQDFSDIQNWSGYVLITDECFDYHTPILLEDGTTELIGRVVSKKLPVRVLSWNSEKGVVEPRAVVNWVRNPLVCGRRKDLRRVSFKYSGNVRVTGNHDFITPNGGATPAYKLHKGDAVLSFSEKIPSDSQWQVILGSLLGDASISGPDRNLRGVSFGHCGAQRALLEFKHGVLETLGVSGIEWKTGVGGYQKKDGSSKEYGKFGLHGNPALSSFLDLAGIRRDGKKRITTEWLDRIGPLGLAVWHADDGRLLTHVCKDGSTSYTVEISTHGFSREDHEVLVGWLRWKWGIPAEVRMAKGKNGKHYSYIHLGRVASDKFFTNLPGALPGVEYKFPHWMPVVDVSGDRKSSAPA
jgi:hypothetical protein